MGLGWFLASSVAVFAQNPVVPQNGEFAILGNIRKHQVWPSISLSPSASVIAWQDNVVDQSGSGIGGAMLNNGFVGQRPFRANKAGLGNQAQSQSSTAGQRQRDFCLAERSVAATQGSYARLASGTTKDKVAYGTNFHTITTPASTFTSRIRSPNSAVAALPDGSATIITWSSYGQDV